MVEVTRVPALDHLLDVPEELLVPAFDKEFGPLHQGLPVVVSCRENRNPADDAGGDRVAHLLHGPGVAGELRREAPLFDPRVTELACGFFVVHVEFARLPVLCEHVEAAVVEERFAGLRVREIDRKSEGDFDA